jgi:hypothetical protein
MKRAFILIGVISVLFGVGLILPALANYGHPGPMANDATEFLLLGVVVALAGVASVFYGIRKVRV